MKATNAAIYGRSVMAAFVRIFAQKVTAHGVPQDGLVSILLFIVDIDLDKP
jgi:hypothetical protein